MGSGAIYRRAYIDMVLDHFIFATNAVDRENPLRLPSEYPIDEPALVATGNATGAVTKGPYIVLVVNDVKHGGIHSSQHPLLATMEAARLINKQVPEPVHHIHAICTDCQILGTGMMWQRDGFPASSESFPGLAVLSD